MCPTRDLRPGNGRPATQRAGRPKVASGGVDPEDVPHRPRCPGRRWIPTDPPRRPRALSPPPGAPTRPRGQRTVPVLPVRRLSVACAAAGLTAGGLAAGLGTATTASAATTTLTPVTTGSVCRYLNPGSAPAGAWTAPGYDDSPWGKGGTPFGHQEQVGTDIGVPAKTSYYRCGFTLPSTFTAQSATLSARVDDGAALSVNGTEVSRTNLPTGTIGYGTSASIVDSYDGTRWLSWSVPAALLRAGSNVVAIELHQNFTSSWISSCLLYTSRCV